PFDLLAVNPDLLDDNEKAWLNNYHDTVYTLLSPLLNDEEKAWLKEETRHI
ncbi:MAG: M24 family metallopeptidase C-terminal domain-containing protein, partial [Clostridiales bacterium]|nr:M24 family metallopeptidase C-terminal domain-containing protein [Clostridiales bacterium]